MELPLKDDDPRIDHLWQESFSCPRSSNFNGASNAKIKRTFALGLTKS